MIKPTVGRMVWYRPGHGESLSHHRDEPLAAQIARVHSDVMVNLMVVDAIGLPHAKTSVPLVQEGSPRPAGAYCEWMPYQKGQAAKTEALEAQLKA